MYYRATICYKVYFNSLKVLRKILVFTVYRKARYRESHKIAIASLFLEKKTIDNLKLRI